MAAVNKTPEFWIPPPLLERLLLFTHAPTNSQEEQLALDCVEMLEEQMTLPGLAGVIRNKVGTVHYSPRAVDTQVAMANMTDCSLALLTSSEEFDLLSSFPRHYTDLSGNKTPNTHGSFIICLKEPMTLQDIAAASMNITPISDVNAIRTRSGGKVITPRSAEIWFIAVIRCSPADQRRMMVGFKGLENVFLSHAFQTDVDERPTGKWKDLGLRESIHHYVVSCDSLELMRLLLSVNVPQDVRVRSALASLYPHIRGKCQRKFEVLDLDEASEIWALADQPEWDFNRFISLTGIFTIGYSFTIEANLARQVHTRISAACAMIGADPPTDKNVQDAVAETRYIAGRSDGRNNMVMGWTVAVDSSGAFDSQVTRANLMPSSELEKKFNWGLWQVGLYDQLRLVTMQLHSTSIRFGISGMAAYDYIGPYITRQMKEEEEPLTTLSELVANRPYTGLVENLPAGMRVATYASSVYFGVCYYKKGLPEKEAINFRLYKVDEIGAKLSHDELNRVKLCVDACPVPDIQQRAALLATVDLNTALIMLDSQPPEVVAALKRVLMTAKVKGPWMESLLESQNRELTSLISSHMESIIDSQIAALATKVGRMVADATSEGERNAIFVRQRKAERILEMCRSAITSGDLRPVNYPSDNLKVQGKLMESEMARTVKQAIKEAMALILPPTESE